MISVIIATCGTLNWSDLAWARAYPSVQRQDCQIVIEHHPDATVEQARNRAAKSAEQPWLCFLDADDELDRSYIAAMEASIQATERPALHAPIVSYVETTEDGMSLVNEAAFPGLPASMPPMNHCVTGTVVQADMFWNVGAWRDGYWPWPDYELWLRCLAAGAHIEYVRDALYLAHVNPRSDSRTLTRQAGARLGNRIVREHRRRLLDAARAP